MTRAVIDSNILARELASIVGERRVSTEQTDRVTYARDMWPRLLLAVREGLPPKHLPHVVVWPENAREVAAIVRLARAQGIAVVPYGGGSGVCGGVVPLRGGITIDLKRMDNLEGIDRETMMCDVEAGVNGERFERELARRGYTFGNFPSSIYCSTVGGWLATRAAGQMSTKYGKVEDRVGGLTVVTGRGEIVRTDGIDRATRGPSWNQLLLGSEGTLGIITSARLRLAHSPSVRLLRGYEVQNVAHGVDTMRRILQRGLRPAVVRLYDEVDTFIHSFGAGSGGETSDAHSSSATYGGERSYRAAGEPTWVTQLRRGPQPPSGGGALPHLGATDDLERPKGTMLSRVSSVLGQIRGQGLGDGSTAKRLARSLKQELMSTALEHPRLLNSVASSVADKLSRKGCLLIIGVEGARIRSHVEADLVFGELARAGAVDLGEEAGQHWLEHRYSVSYKMSPMFRDGAFVDTMEVASTWERLQDMYEAVRSAIGKHAMVMAHFSHAYPEGCSIYFSFAGHADNHRDAERLYDAVWRDGLAATSRVGGTISHHHGVGMLKAAHMSAEHGEAMAIFRALKRTLDPDGIMNPGKMGLQADSPASARIRTNEAAP